MQHLLERPLVQLRFVEQFDLLAVVRQTPVVLRDQGLQPRGKLPAAGVDAVAVFDELPVVDRQHRLVGLHLEQAVAFGEYGVVPHQGRQVGTVELRDEGVEVAAPLVGRIADQGTVRRGDDHRRNQPYVVRQPVILLAVALEHLAALAREGADDLLAPPRIGAVAPLDEEEVGSVADALPVGHLERRFAHRQVVDRIHDVGLSGAVVTHQAVDARAEGELLLGDVFEIEQRNFLQVHRTKVQNFRTRHCTF